jgi:hypothetical protein
MDHCFSDHEEGKEIDARTWIAHRLKRPELFHLYMDK